MNLNGTWRLYYRPQEDDCVVDVTRLSDSGIPSVPCTVPGNVELDLSRAGILPEDLYKGENIRKAEVYEIYEWWYETVITAPTAPQKDHRMILRFGAVDCFADYYLNGEKIHESANMFLEQTIDVTDSLHYGEENQLVVHIRSASIKGAEYEVEPHLNFNAYHRTTSALYVRKAPHSYGWDIMPRALSAGIWRDVTLTEECRWGFRYVYPHLQRMEGDRGVIKVVFDSTVPREHLYADITYKITGTCGDHTFTATDTFKSPAGFFSFSVDGLKLWWPRPYGEQNLYDITLEATTADGKLHMTHSFRFGFRTLELRRSDIVQKDGAFEFIVNGRKIHIVGSNWVPMDAYHSRDKERYPKALELAADVGCNMLRCWGGNVYEDHAFFDLCDEYGILVWQDFSMACHYYPQTAEFADMLRAEVESVVKKLRLHPSLAVWAGDNEIDEAMYKVAHIKPSVNMLTRSLIPAVLDRLDPYRPYIPSSPYITDEAFRLGDKYFPENHLWGPRDYFKSDFYTGSNAYFVSETGYHGCPARSSIEKFIDPEYVWPYFNNPQWNLHSSDQQDSDSRTMLMHKQVQQFFGEVPTDMDTYILASQISQAEAKKFFIERIRGNMSYTGGILWWNLVDGWPQMSDAVVDYYYEKKLAYEYIKRSSRPFMIMLAEMNSWGHPVRCANSTFDTVRGTMKITDLDSGEVKMERTFTAAPNGNTDLGKLPLMYSDKGMFLITWETEDGQRGYNTYLYGMPAFDLKKYLGWLEKLKAYEATLGK